MNQFQWPVPRGRLRNWPEPFDLHSWVVYLVRDDVRNGGAWDDEATQRRFLLWWLCGGRSDYRHTSALPGQVALAWSLGMSVHVDRDQNAQVPILLDWILAQRDDIVTAFRTTEPGGRERAMGWLLIYGRRELHLEDLFPPWVLEWLEGESMAPDGSPLGLSRLMHFCHAADAGLRQQFNILEDVGRAAYMAWCLTGGFRHLGVDTLTSSRNTPTLDEPVTPAQTGHIPPPDHAVALVGYAFGELGIGEDVRSMAAALRTADVPFGILDFPKGLAARQQDYTAATDIADHSTAPVTCFCLTGFDTGRYLVERGEARFAESYVVGYWPWELPHWPRPWSVAFELVDEVWVSSRFTQDALQLVSPVPVIYMPMCVRLAPPVRFDRSTLGAILGNFLFLYVFDANSYLERKNPTGVIAAFRRAFPAMTEPVGLVLKVMNAPLDSAAWEAVAEAARQDPRIRIVAMTTTRTEVLGLIEACDAYVSLHRSEGFGRTIAEAMLLERPVVATGWSGSDELVTEETALAVRSALIPVEPGAYPWADGAQWADPDLDHAAYCLRQTVQDSQGRAKRVAVARSRVEERHSAAAVGARYRERLSLIGQIINGKTAR